MSAEVSVVPMAANAQTESAGVSLAAETVVEMAAESAVKSVAETVAESVAETVAKGVADPGSSCRE